MIQLPTSLSYRLACWQIQRRPTPSYVPGRLLLCYPADQYTFPEDYRHRLQQYFSEVIPLSCSTHASEKDIKTLPAPGWTGLVPRDALRVLQSIQPEVVIHLDTSFHLAAEHAIAMLPARLRVAFHHPMAEPFYDVLIATNTQDIKARARVLLQYLERIIGSNIVQRV